MKKIVVSLSFLALLFTLHINANAAEELDAIFMSSIDKSLNFVDLIELDLRNRFIASPEEFLTELSRQSSTVQKKVIFLIIWEHKHGSVYDGMTTLTDVLESNSYKKEFENLLALIKTELNRKTPDYRELFTRQTDGWATEALGLELRQAFERNPLEFVQRLSIYKAKWQLQTISILTYEYFIVDGPERLKTYIKELKSSEDVKNSYLCNITVDNLRIFYYEHASTR